MARRESPQPTIVRILTGHERRLDNQCWRARGTPSLLLVHTRSGHAEIRTQGRDPLLVSSGDTVLWHADARHDFGTIGDGEPWEVIWAHFHPREHWRDWLAWPNLGPGVAWIPAPRERLRDRIGHALAEMDSYARSAFPRGADFALNALERAVLWLGAANPNPSRMDEPVQEAILFISRHLDQRIVLRDVAEAVHLSPSRFAHLFKQQIGTSPARFVEQRRLERAQALLEASSLSIRNVSEATGFSSQFHFSTRFRKHTGLSPRAWRRRAAVSP